MARSVIDCLNDKMKLSQEYRKAQDMMSEQTRAKLRVPRSITQKRLEDFQRTYDFVLDKYSSNSSPDVAARAAAKETLELATQAMEAKQKSIALSLEKSDSMISSVASVLEGGGSLKDSVNALAFSSPALRYQIGDKLGLSVEESVKSHQRAFQSMYQKAFKSLSPEAKFHLVSQDPRMSKSIARDYFDAAYGRKRESPKEIKEIVDTLLNNDKVAVDMLKARGVLIPDKGVEAYLGGLNSVGERVALSTREQYVQDMMALESSIDWDRVRKIIPEAYTPEAKEELFGFLYDMEVKGRVTDMPPLLKHVGRRIQSTREHMRLIQFTNAEGWMKYQEKYGQPLFGDILNNYTERTAKTLGVLDVYGPNPSEALNRVLNYLRPKLNANEATLIEREVTTGMEYWLRGFQDPLTPNKRSLVNSVLNLLRSSLLGMHSIDGLLVEAPVVAPRANAFAGLPVMDYFKSWTKDLLQTGTAKQQREALARAGYFMEDLMYDIHSGYNSAAMMRSEKATGWMAKAVEKMSLNKMITMTNRAATAHNFANSLTDVVMSGGKDPTVSKVAGALLFPTPNEKSFMRYLSGFGIQLEDLAKLKDFVEDFGTAGTPFNRVNITKLYQSSDKSLNELGVKLQAAAQNLISTASPESNKYVAARARKVAESGTAGSYLSAFGMQFAGYISDFYARQVKLTNYSKFGDKAASLAALTIMTTVGGVLTVQLRSLLAGKDPENISPSLVLKGFVRSGVTGRVGDFIFSAGANPNAGIMDKLFPVVSPVKDTFKIGFSNAMKAYQGKKTSVGYDTIKLLKGLTPGQNLWWTRTLLDREVFDQLLMAADQERFKKNARTNRTQLKKDGSDYWWYPGDLSPK